MQSLFVLKNEVPHSIHEPAHLLTWKNEHYKIIETNSCFDLSAKLRGQLNEKEKESR